MRTKCKENPEKCIASLLPGKMDEHFARRALDFYLNRNKPLDEQIKTMEQVETSNCRKAVQFTFFSDAIGWTISEMY